MSLSGGILVDGAPVNSNIWRSRYHPNVHTLSNNENRTGLAFKTTELSAIEHDMYKFFFHTPSIFGMGNEYDKFFIRFGVPDYWMYGAYYAPNPKRLRSKTLGIVDGRHTHRHTNRDDRSNMQTYS
jgi:hypothetical protein